MPPGRTPVETRWSDEASLKGVWEFMRREVTRGRQGFVLYPVIEESETQTGLSLKAAQQMYDHLSREVFPDVSVGLLHGRLGSGEKEAAMEKFKRGDTKIRSGQRRIAVTDGSADRTPKVRAS